MHIEHPSFSAPQSIQQARRKAEEGSVGTPPQKMSLGAPGLKMISLMVKYISQTRTAEAPQGRDCLLNCPLFPKRKKLFAKLEPLCCFSEFRVHRKEDDVRLGCVGCRGSFFSISSEIRSSTPPSPQAPPQTTKGEKLNCFFIVVPPVCIGCCSDRV